MHVAAIVLAPELKRSGGGELLGRAEEDGVAAHRSGLLAQALDHELARLIVERVALVDLQEGDVDVGARRGRAREDLDGVVRAWGERAGRWVQRHGRDPGSATGD